MNILRLLLFISALLSSATAGKILFYSSARLLQSHIYFMGRIADVLTDAGHNVVSPFIIACLWLIIHNIDFFSDLLPAGGGRRGAGGWDSAHAGGVAST